MWNKIRRRSWGERWLALEALAWLGVFGLAVRSVRFERIARWCGLHPADPGEAPSLPRDAEEAAAVEWAIGAAGRPAGGYFTCLARALAAGMMLKRRGIPARLYLGVDGTREPVRAHAWLACAGRLVTGAAGREAFHPVGCFRTL